MVERKTAFFRFEASPTIGAGHAIRSCVIADALVERGLECFIVTTETSYELIKSLARFDRIDPDQFYKHPVSCDLLVVDNYDLDQTYEQHFRPFAQKILVIDDLANRPHECDVLVDQTYGRAANDYKSLVPDSCVILTGGDYALIRKEFRELRPKALEKRRNTTEIKRVLISMGGGDVIHWTIEALKMLNGVDFKGEIDIAIGFSVEDKSSIDQFIKTLSNKVIVHVNGNMPELNYNADFAIGAAGSSVWERACLGLPQFLIMTADNQKEIVKLFSDVNFSELYARLQNNYQNYKNYLVRDMDGLGINRICSITEYPQSANQVHLRKATLLDKDVIFEWQNSPQIRQYFKNPNPPTYSDHQTWFDQRINQYENPYWIICENQLEIGVISLVYDGIKNHYDLSWLVVPEKHGQGLGAKSLKLALEYIKPFKVHAFVMKNNIASHKSLIKLDFECLDGQNYIRKT